MAEKIFDILSEARIVADIEIDRQEHARALGETLLAAGITTVAVVLRTDAALPAAERMAELPGLTVGLGSVIEADQLRFGKQLGAEFASLPGINADLLTTARMEKVPCLPGVYTPSETMLALDLECEVVKFFPAMLDAANFAFSHVARSFPRLRYCLSGGINEGNLARALKMDNVIAVSGTWIAPRAAIAARAWQGISERAAAAVQLAAAAALPPPSPSAS